MATYQCSDCRAFETLYYFPDGCSHCAGEVSYVPGKDTNVRAERNADARTQFVSAIWAQTDSDHGTHYTNRPNAYGCNIRKPSGEVVERYQHRAIRPIGIEFPVKFVLTVSVVACLFMLLALPDGMAACTETHSFDVCHGYLYR